MGKLGKLSLGEVGEAEVLGRPGKLKPGKLSTTGVGPGPGPGLLSLLLWAARGTRTAVELVAVTR